MSRFSPGAPRCAPKRTGSHAGHPLAPRHSVLAFRGPAWRGATLRIRSRRGRALNRHGDGLAPLPRFHQRARQPLPSPGRCPGGVRSRVSRAPGWEAVIPRTGTGAAHMREVGARAVAPQDRARSAAATLPRPTRNGLGSATSPRRRQAGGHGGPRLDEMKDTWRLQASPRRVGWRASSARRSTTLDTVTRGPPPAPSSGRFPRPTPPPWRSRSSSAWGAPPV